MAWSFKKRTVEYIIYLLFWSVLLLSPLFGAFIKSAFYKDDTFMPTVDELVAFWGFLLPAIILFFINNNILMPSLLYKKMGRRFVLYLLCVVDDSAKPIVSLLSMKKIEESLPAGQFMRVHRSYLVNLNKVKEVSKMRIVYDGGVYVPIGDMYKEQFFEYIDKLFVGKGK